ncbi:hypothetical protein F5Y14DRAFT_278713 [Nemania sp. NC0429]|nr:hypothetical protein F5Y14DRAFT_278713 [Nemania sp. NC0429]
MTHYCCSTTPGRPSAPGTVRMPFTAASAGMAIMALHKTTKICSFTSDSVFLFSRFYHQFRDIPTTGSPVFLTIVVGPQLIISLQCSSPSQHDGAWSRENGFLPVSLHSMSLDTAEFLVLFTIAFTPHPQLFSHGPIFLSDFDTITFPFLSSLHSRYIPILEFSLYPTMRCGSFSLELVSRLANRLSPLEPLETIRSSSWSFWMYHPQSVDIPAYTVVVPRPWKPPLVTKQPIPCKRNNNSAVDLSKSRNSLTLTAVLAIILVYGAPNKAFKTRSSRDLAMALGSGTPNSGQWLDDTIAQSQLYDLQAYSVSLTQEAATSTCESMITKETLPPNHLGTRHGHKRVFNSISNPDEEDSTQQTKLQKRPSTARKFACPFTKETGKNYLSTKDWKCCLGPGPGFTIHRLKEHLYRKHSSSGYQCPRCLAEFKESSKLHQHQRSKTPCPVQANSRSCAEKIDAQQVVQLKKKTRLLSDEEKWSDIYRIVFRLDSTADVPSPYFENIAPSPPKSEPSSCYTDDSLCQFQSYLQNRLRECHETQQSPSTIQACIELIRGFRETTGDFPLPESNAPPLVFDDSVFPTMSYEYQPGGSTTSSTTDESNFLTSSPFQGIETGTLNGVGVWDDFFEAGFH